MADAGSDIAYEDLAVFRSVEVDFFYLEGFACFPGDSSTGFHYCPFLMYFFIGLDVRMNARGAVAMPPGRFPARSAVVHKNNKNRDLY